VARHIIEATGDNTFNDGWLRYVLGLPRPTDPAAADGWDMGAETSQLQAVRYIFESQLSLEHPQYRVTSENG
jgi:hypothetical protein